MKQLLLASKIFVWPFMAVIAIALKAFSFFLGWLLIAPFVWIGKDGNYPQPIRMIFQPDDSLAIGDDPLIATTVFQDREGAFTKPYPEWVRNYILAVMWSCMRNPAYGWDSNICGIPSDIKIITNVGRDIDWSYDSNDKAIYTLGFQFIATDTGHWNLRYAFVIPFTTRGFLCSFGWNLSGDVFNSSTRNLKIDVAGKSTEKDKF